MRKTISAKEKFFFFAVCCLLSCMPIVIGALVAINTGDFSYIEPKDLRGTGQTFPFHPALAVGLVVSLIAFAISVLAFFTPEGGDKK